MAKAQKAIITCAVTGAIHTPSMSPYLPVTPAEIADAAVGAAEAGALLTIRSVPGRGTIVRVQLSDADGGNGAGA